MHGKLAPVLLGLLLAIAPVQPVMAAEKGKEAPKPQTMSLEAVALPVIVDGKLINYVFCSITLLLAPNADGSKVRAKEQYFRDDLVRTGHRTPFTLRDNYSKVDEAKVRAEIMRFAPTVVGPGVVQSANITKQSSQKMLTLPPVPQSRPHDLIP
jgi:hypothetical protein